MAGGELRPTDLLATNMDMGCVAEGVETEQTAELLEQLGVRDLQGYLIARPMPVTAVPAWLASWTESGSATSRGDPPDLKASSTADLGKISGPDHLIPAEVVEKMRPGSSLNAAATRALTGDLSKNEEAESRKVREF
jgi:EAL domain